MDLMGGACMYVFVAGVPEAMRSKAGNVFVYLN